MNDDTRRTRAKALAWIGLLIWAMAVILLLMDEPWKSLAMSMVGALCAGLSIALSKRWIT